MTKFHTLEYYDDGGYVKKAFCKVCSAEGDKLLEDCQGPYVSGLPFFKHLTREQFEEKFGAVEEKYLDDRKPKG